MALFENSDITLLRYNSGIFFWFRFIAADVQKNTSIKKGIISLSLSLYSFMNTCTTLFCSPDSLVSTSIGVYSKSILLLYFSFLMSLKESKSMSLRALFCPVYPKSFTAIARERIN